jgi:RND family efflux transporter MFP subunit
MLWDTRTIHLFFCRRKLTTFSSQKEKEPVTTLSQPRPNRRFNLPLIPSIIAVALIVALIVSLAAGQGLFGGADALQGRTSAAASRDTVVDEVIANGAIEPRLSSALTFPGSGGRVSRVLVAPGDSVAAGDPLIELELRRLSAAVAVAQADLARAQADRQELLAGATAEQIAAAQAQVAQARGALVQLEGSITSDDIRAAQARVAEAQALVARLEAGARATDAQAADAQVAQAQAALQNQRDTLSATKTNAELALQRATADLTRAQAAYAEAKSNWEYVRDTGNDPIAPTRVNAQGRSVDNEATPGQREQYYAAFVTAEAALRSAEAAVQQAVVNFDNARQAEVSGIRSAEAQLAAVTANAEKVRAGADADAIAAARAQLAAARAELTRLQGDARAGALDAQRATLAAAEAQLAQLTADPTASALARAEAAVARAEAQLELAQADLDDATLRAPFAGVVGSVNIEPGEAVGNESPITLLDTDRYVVTLNVDEIDVVRIAVGQPVSVAIDALGGAPLAGAVQRITPLASDAGNVTSYEVRVEVDPAGAPVLPGMTASAAIEIARADAAITIPAAAVREENGVTVVDVITTGADGRRSIATQPVEVGIMTSTVAEIRSGLQEGQEVLLP